MICFFLIKHDSATCYWPICVGACLCVPPTTPNSVAFVLLHQTNLIGLLQDSDILERFGSGLCVHLLSTATSVL